MAPKPEDITDEDAPVSINPYEVLGIEKDASADLVKSAYRKAALKAHPDKVAPEFKDEAHHQFQKIAFAYAVLSDPLRRKRYDTTGSCSDSITDSDGFNWSDYYSEQYRDAISSEAIDAFTNKYKGSDEEKDDLLLAFAKYQGMMSKIYETVMLSNVLEDDDRFRALIDQAIKDGNVEGYPAYVNESAKSKAARKKEAQKQADSESVEALAYAEELGVADKLFGKKMAKGSASKDSGEDALAALIAKRQQDRASFFDYLEEKYSNSSAKGKKNTKGKKRGSPEEAEDDSEPSEEAFQAAARRLKGGSADVKAGRKAKKSKQ